MNIKGKEQEQLSESALNKRKRSSFDSDDSDDSSSSDEEETFNSHNNIKNNNVQENNQNGNDLNIYYSNVKNEILSKLSKNTILISQNELDLLEQQVLTNPISFSSEWNDLLEQYQYRSYIDQLTFHDSTSSSNNRRNTDLPSQYSILLGNQYVNVSAWEKLRYLRWKRSECLKLGEEFWMDWIREEELHLFMVEINDSDRVNERNVIKCIYERALVWENSHYKKLRINYCNFMLKNYMGEEDLIENSFNLLFNLVGYDDVEICKIYLNYLKKQNNVDSKIRNIYSNMLKHPNQSVFNIWKEYTQWETNQSDEMKAKYIHALVQVDERVSFQKEFTNETLFMEMINFEMKKYNDCKNMIKSKDFSEMSLEDLTEIGSILKERIILLLRRASCEIQSSENLWNTFLNFLICERNEFLVKMNESSHISLFQSICASHLIIGKYNYLENNCMVTYVKNIEEPSESLLSALEMNVSAWIAFKNLPFNSEMHKYLLESLELIHESHLSNICGSVDGNIYGGNFQLIVEIYMKLLNDTMFNKCMHALNSFANDLVFYDYYHVFSTFCSCMTRLNRRVYLNLVGNSTLQSNNSDTTCLIEISQKTDWSFQNFSDYLDQYFKNDSSRMHYFELEYAEFMLENGQSQRALDYFESIILNNESFKKELRVWQDYIQLMERANWFEMVNNEKPLEIKHEKISATYELGVHSIEHSTTKQILAKMWLHYEKVNSNSVNNIIKVEAILQQLTQKKKNEQKPSERKSEEKKERPKKKVKFSNENVEETNEMRRINNIEMKETRINVDETNEMRRINVGEMKEATHQSNEEPSIEKQEKIKILETSSSTNETRKETYENESKEVKKPEKDDKCLNVLIWNLPFRMKEEDIRELFQQFSFQTKRITLITHENGSSKGMAFVELESQEIIQQAIEKLHNYGIDQEGNLLKVSKAETSKMKKLLKKQKEISNKLKSETPKFIKESDTRQKKPSMFKPRAVQKKNEMVNQTETSTSSSSQNQTSINETQQSTAGLSNDDFKKFLR